MQKEAFLMPPQGPPLAPPGQVTSRQIKSGLLSIQATSRGRSRQQG